MPQPDFDPLMQACNLCHAADIRFYDKDYKGIQIYKCHNCRIKFMNPQYADQFLTDFYSEYQKLDKKHHRYGDAEDTRRILHALNLKDIEKFTTPGKFLSIGCGNGIDLVVAKARGWSVEGYEVDPDFSKDLSHKLDVTIRSGPFAALDYDANAYDCVYLNHVIEHPKNPSDYLRKCHQLLKPGGIMYIATPNIEALSIHVRRLFEKLHIKPLKGSYYDTWQHLFYYSPATLKHLLETYYHFEVLLTGNDRKFRQKQSPFARKIINVQASTYPYKSSFRLIARKK